MCILISTFYITATWTKPTTCCTSAVIYSFLGVMERYQTREEHDQESEAELVGCEDMLLLLLLNLLGNWGVFFFTKHLAYFPALLCDNTETLKALRGADCRYRWSTISCLYTFPVKVHTLGLRELNMLSLLALNLTRKVYFSCQWNIQFLFLPYEIPQNGL